MDFEYEVKELLEYLKAEDTENNRRFVTLHLEKAVIQGKQLGLDEAQTILDTTPLEAVK